MTEIIGLLITKEGCPLCDFARKTFRKLIELYPEITFKELQIHIDEEEEFIRKFYKIDIVPTLLIIDSNFTKIYCKIEGSKGLKKTKEIIDLAIKQGVVDQYELK